MFKIIWCGIVLLSGASALASETVLAPFHSDGCSLFPNGTPASPRLWCGCCVAHDLAYWQGGTEEDKRRADAELQHCVSAAAGSSTLGALMQAGVRAGGVPQLPTPFRWGYGWHQCANYQALGAQESGLVREVLAAHSYADEVSRVCQVSKP